MKNLFYKNFNEIKPLAHKVRPMKLESFIGQKKIIGEKTVLRNLISSGDIMNSIFWGPPGTGKTTLAEIIANELNFSFEKLNATTANLTDFREVIKKAESRIEYESKRTILFLDEIHRFNKLQQDSLLPYTENGIIVLMGATTENPYYTLNNALISRCMIYEFEKLSKQDIEDIIISGAKEKKIQFHKNNILDAIVELSSGDARVALNYVELYSKIKDSMDDKEIVKLFGNRKEAYHKKEDKYNIISAFIKSIRGSDPDAAIYWLARMLDGGEDPRYIARRLIIHACEDVGMANPEAILVCRAALESAEKIGMPEVRIILAEATIYLAISTKSNSVEDAIDRALADIKNGNVEDVPRHLKNEYKEEYKYPHSYRGNFVEQVYQTSRKQYYKPNNNKNEKLIQSKLEGLWKHKKYG